MPRVDAKNTSKEIEEAIFHLNNTLKNTHDVVFARWCHDEIDRLLDARLQLSSVRK